MPTQPQSLELHVFDAGLTEAGRSCFVSLLLALMCLRLSLPLNDLVMVRGGQLYHIVAFRS